MPQTFGPEGSSFPIYSPEEVRQARARFNRDRIPQLSLANSLYVASGKWPAQGWLLMPYSSYRQITTYTTKHQLKIDDFLNPSITFKNLSIVQARCVTTGVTNSEDALFLVQVTDARGTFYNPWFQQGTASQYNVVATAYPGQYYASSMNGGVPWTWGTMTGDLWGQMPLLGTYPGLPVTQVGTPENWLFPGTSVWEALCDVLDYQGLTVAVDLTSDAPFTIVQCGGADATATAFLAANVAEDDYAWIDTGSGRVPGNVVVYFHRRNAQYGTEETIRPDSLQWLSTPLYSVPVTATQAGFSSFSGGVGTHHLWADFSVRYDMNNTPLAADVVTAQAIAIDQASGYYDVARRGTGGYMKKVFTGCRRLGTSGQIDGLCWHQTMTDPQRAGWRTTMIRGFAWDEVQFKKDAMGVI